MTKPVGYEELPVTQVELEFGISSGIHLRSIGDGLIPFQEEHEARLERGITLGKWSKMNLIEKALIVAVRRNRIAMQNIQTEAEIRKTKQETSRARGHR